MSKITQTMRFEIAFDKVLYKMLDDISHAVWRVKNKATTMAYDWQQFSFGYNERFGEFPKDKELMGVCQLADTSRNTKKLAPFIASTIADTAAQNAVKNLKEMRLDISKGNKAIPNYRRDGSFPMRAQGIKELARINSAKYSVKLSLLSKEGAIERETTTQQPVTLKTGNGANLILDRILDGSYKLCDSNISKKKTKYYLMVAYQFEAEAKPNLSESKVMGIDMGVVKAAAIAFNEGRDHYYIEGDEIRAFRSRTEARRNALLRQGKYCGDGRNGHGTTTHLKPIEKLRGKVDNFKTTTNHRYAKFIVDKAIKHSCGVIQMEDLSGITDNANKFLKAWTYYDLQQKIEQKAKIAGIKVHKVKPNYTSQRCSCCGYIAEGNRESQSEFHCKVCGFKTNADYNAAVNIAQPNIEELIEKEFARQKLARKMAN